MKNKRGFSLLEILVAMAMLGGLSLGVMQVMKHMRETQMTADVQSEIAQLRTRIDLFMTMKGSCIQTLKVGSTLKDLQDIKRILYASPSTKEAIVAYKVGDIFLNSIQIEKIDVTSNPSNKYEWFFNVHIKKLKDGALGAKDKILKFPLFVETDNQGRLRSCFGDDSEKYEVKDFLVNREIQLFDSSKLKEFSTDQERKLLSNCALGDYISGITISSEPLCSPIPKCKDGLISVNPSLKLKCQKCMEGHVMVLVPGKIPKCMNLGEFTRFI